MSLSSTADQFYLKGQWKIAQVIRDLVRQVARCPIPRAREAGPGLAFLSLLYTTNLFWDSDLQCWKQKRLVYQPTKKKDDIDGQQCAVLNKWGISTALSSGNRNAFLPTRPGLFLDERRTYANGDDYCSEELPVSVGHYSESHHSQEVRRARLEQRFSPFGDSVIQGLGSTFHFVDTRPEPASERTNFGLAIAKSELDFRTSVKRGGFKPKRRWVSLHS
jgi:hypothetical protein